MRWSLILGNREIQRMRPCSTLGVMANQGRCFMRASRWEPRAGPLWGRMTACRGGVELAKNGGERPLVAHQPVSQWKRQVHHQSMCRLMHVALWVTPNS